MLVHSFSAMVSCFTFLSEGVRCALGVAIVVGGGSGGFAPSFPERAFFLSFIFINSVVYIFPLLFLFFFSSLPPLSFFFFFLVCFERTAKGFAWTLPLRFLHLATCKRNIFAFSFPFCGIVVLSFESSSVEAIPFFPRRSCGLICPASRAGRAVPKRPGSFRCRSPVGAAALPPAACRIPPLPRRPGRRCPLRSEIARWRARGSAGHRDGSPRRWETTAVLSPRNISKTLAGNDRFVWSLFRRLLVTKWQWAWIFQGFLGTRSVISATVFISVLLRARGRILGCGRIIISIMAACELFFLFVENTCS